MGSALRSAALTAAGEAPEDAEGKFKCAADMTIMGEDAAPGFAEAAGVPVCSIIENVCGASGFAALEVAEVVAAEDARGEEGTDGGDGLAVGSCGEELAPVSDFRLTEGELAGEGAAGVIVGTEEELVGEGEGEGDGVVEEEEADGEEEEEGVASFAPSMNFRGT